MSEPISLRSPHRAGFCDPHVDQLASKAQAAQLTSAGLALANNLESGLIAVVPPGPYTALLFGVNNGTGVGLVEVYDLGAP